MFIAQVIFWTATGLILYVYAGYPLVLKLLRSLSGERPVGVEDIEPKVTQIISAFNEEDVLREKIENSLALDYPRDKLEVLVISDASDDATDDIAKSFADDGVVLHRMEERGGKTLGLNKAAEIASGEILVFSDANAMYAPDAIRKLIRNFGDAEVGAVIGESTYEDSDNTADKSESAYWRYELAIKKLESQIGSVVGGDGAIYAIRKEHYRPMSADALSDFVNPLQIIEQGLRCVYEPEAVSSEDAAGSFDKEFRRKVRIVNRAWRAMTTMWRVLNPFRFGKFSWQLLSHKVLRWLVPFFMLIAFVTNAMVFALHDFYQITFYIQLVFYLLAIVGSYFYRRGPLNVVLHIPFYFCLVNVASARAIVEHYWGGATYTTWSTARTDN